MVKNHNRCRARIERLFHERLDDLAMGICALGGIAIPTDIGFDDHFRAGLNEFLHAAERAENLVTSFS